MKNSIYFSVVAVISTLIAGNSNAQIKQTVEGAQKFLQSQAENAGPAGMWPFWGVNGIVTSTGDLSRGKYGPLAKTIYSIDMIDESGESNPCVTRVNKIGDQAPSWLAGGVSWKYEPEFLHLSMPLSSFPVPRYFHWGKVSIKREKIGRYDGTDMRDTIMAIYLPSPGAKTEVLGFEYVDPGMADRTEYAMKFLQASCDITADTGF